MGKLITIIEASRRLGLTEQTMRNWIKDGHLSVKEVGRARYLDEDTINALQDTVEDMHKAQRYVNALYEEKRMDAEWRADERYHDKLLQFVSGLTLRTGFFSIVINLLKVYGDINERDAAFLTHYVYGSTLEDIGEKYGLTRERARQIIEKAIRKSRNIMTIEEEINNARALRAENEALKNTIAQMQEKLAVYEQPAEVRDEQAEGLKEMCELLSTKLVDCNISIRALNCLVAGRTERKFSFGKREDKVIVPSCRTIGDLCKLQKTDFLKIRNAGKKSLIEIDDFLKSKGLDWGMDVDRVYRQYALITMSHE